MTQRSLVKIGCIAVALLFFVAIVFAVFVPSTVRLSQAQLQNVFSLHLPKQFDGVVMERGAVNFEDDRVLLGLSMRGKKFGKAFSLTMSATGQPDYDPMTGSFYFRPTAIKVEEFTTGVSISEQLANASDRYLPGNVGAKNLGVDIGKVIDQRLPKLAEQTAVTALNRMPIYTLPNTMKGFATRAVLDSVKIVNNELVISFTLWRLTWWVITMVLICFAAIGLLYALVRHPGIFLSTLAVGGVAE